VPDERITRVTDPSAVGSHASANVGAGIATRDLLVFLNSETVLLPGWLEPACLALGDSDGIGAVGGRLLYPDGRLREAGWLAFRDGSLARIGDGALEPDAPAFASARDTAFAAMPFLATRRSWYADLGGMSTAYGTGPLGEIDYCLRLHEEGRRVLYQPATTVVDLDPQPWSPTATEDRFERFRTRWSDLFRTQPERDTVAGAFQVASNDGPAHRSGWLDP
jgi:GT2 family glycosyltransferase